MYSQEYFLSIELTKKIKILSKNMDASLYYTLFSTFILFLSKITKKDIVSVGTTMNGRNKLSLQSAVGYFIDTVSAIIECSARDCFIDLVAKVKDVISIHNSQTKFESMFTFLGKTDRLVSEKSDNEHLQLENLNIDFSFSEFNLVVFSGEKDGKIFLRWEYNAACFSANTIDIFHKSMRSILKQILLDTNVTLSTYHIHPAIINTKTVTKASGVYNSLLSNLTYSMLKNYESIAIYSDN